MGFDDGGDEDELDLEPVEEKVAFIDRSAPAGFFAGVVLANACFIGIDTDVRATGSSMFFTAGTVAVADVMFLFIFTVELILRICADRCPKFFYSGWNLLDGFLVVSSGADYLMSSSGGGSGLDKMRAVRLVKLFRLVRILRLLRVFRFKRLLRAIRGLIMLVFAIITALKALGWVILMFAILTYLFSIITTEFIGMAESDYENPEDEEEILEWFGDIVKSMFTLLQLTTLADWSYIARKCGELHGPIWLYFFMLYVLATNTILMNVVLATLIEKLILLNEEVKEAAAGEASEVESWMLTPSSLASEPDEDPEDKKEEEEQKKEEGQTGPTQSAADRLAMVTLNEFFDLASKYVGIEGQNQRKLATQGSISEALARGDVASKLLHQACPALVGADHEELAQKIWEACPKRQDKEGLSRQELAEACMSTRVELSMNHFVIISQALQSLERHIDHELVHLNKHQRKMNRRFVKLRHRLRKVYHFDGAPKKMVELVNEIKRKNREEEAKKIVDGDEPVEAKEGGGGGGDDSSEIALSTDEDDDEWG